MKSKYSIAIIPGDGVGKEVIPQAVEALKACAQKNRFTLEFREIECGAEYYLKTGMEWDKDAFDRCKKTDAILFGAVGLPQVRLPTGESAGSGVIFGLRMGLDLYANVRPTKLYPKVMHRVSGKFCRVWDNVDFVIVRENTEGLYTPVRGSLARGGEEEIAIDTRVITRKGAERVVRFAFELAKKRDGTPGDGTRRVTCVDKSNVLRGCQLFRKVFAEVGSNYPGIDKESLYVDTFALSIVREPERYDVAVTSNLMGDILTDLSAALQGGLGMAPSGNIGDNHGLFEPVHGSAPDIAGKDRANPIGAILSAGMMLSWLGEKNRDKRLTGAAGEIESAVAEVIRQGKTTTPDIGGKSTCSSTGRAVVDKI